MAVKHINQDDWASEVKECDKPVLVDFFATWCGPCQMLGPVIEEFADTHDEIKVVKVDTDENQELCEQYDIMAVPTVILFEKGEVKVRHEGFAAPDVLEDMCR